MTEQIVSVIVLFLFVFIPFLLLALAVIKMICNILGLESEPDLVFVQTHWLACPPIDTIDVMVDEDGNVLTEQHFSKEIIQVGHVDDIDLSRLMPVGEKR
jgi:hypothetical protein